MDDLTWKKLTRRFPRVPEDFQIERAWQRAEPERPLQGGNRPVIALAFSPDGASLAASGGGLIPGAVDIRVFDVPSRELRKICHYHCMGVFTLAFDPRTGLLASASHDYSVVLCDLDRDDAIFLVGGPDAGVSRNAAKFIGTRAIVADGKTFQDERAALTTFDLATGDIQVLFELEGDLGISHLEVLPSDELLIATIDNMRFSDPSEICCVTLDGTQRARIRLESGLYDTVALDGQTLVATGSSGEQTEVLVLDAASGQIKARRSLGPEIGAYVASSPGADRVAVAYDRGVEVCRLETLQPDLQLQLVDEQPCSVAWSPDGVWIAVGTVERTIRLFDATTGTEHLA